MKHRSWNYRSGLAAALVWMAVMGMGMPAVWAQTSSAGQLDPSFGTGGITLTNFPGTLYQVKVLSDGKILASGDTRDDSSIIKPNFLLVRFNSNGSVDTTFGTGGQVVTDFGDLGRDSESRHLRDRSSYDTARGLAVQSDGKILLVGSSGANAEGWAVARYLPNGSLDPSFGNAGRIMVDPSTVLTNPNSFPYNYLFDVDVLPDGKILLSGSVHYDFGIARLNPDGSFDTTFGDNGVFAHSMDIPEAARFSQEYCYDLVVQPDGKMVIAGRAYRDDKIYGFLSSFGLMRVTSDGHLDPAFGNNGQVITKVGFWNEINRIVLQPNGYILAVGLKMSLARYKPNGSLDTTFGTDGYVITAVDGNSTREWGSTSEGWDLALQPDGKIIIGGHTEALTPAGEDKGWCFALVRFNPDGSFDTSFGSRGDGKVRTDVDLRDDRLFKLALQPDGAILAVGGSGTNLDSNARATIIRYQGDELDNQAPKIVSGPTALPNPALVNQVVSFHVDATDADGDSLTYNWELGDGASALGTDPAHAYGSSGNFTARVTVSDGKGGSDTASILVTVNAPNGAPTANPASVTVNEDASKAIGLTGSDPEGDALTYAILSGPSNGSLTGAAPNVTYKPDPNFNGSDSFTFKVNDGQLDSTIATVSITINPVNDSPLINSGPTATPNPANVNEVVAFSAGATDVDGDVLSYSWQFGDGTGGSGTTTSHAYAAAGSYTITLTVTDGNGGTVQASLDVTVNDSDAPALDITTVVLKGTASDASGIASLTVDGVNVPVGTNGSWQHEVTLAGATTSVTVVTTDGGGNAAMRVVTIGK